MRILFFGDGAWATQSLLRLVEEGFQLLGVVARRQPSDPNLLKFAQELKLPIFQPKGVNHKKFLAQVEELNPELNLSVSYDQILRRPIIESAPKGFINFHAGQLPYYRGRNVVNWALINGETEIGLTAHYVAEGIDTGDIILQQMLPIDWRDSYGDLLERLVAAFPDLVADTVTLITEGKVVPKRQTHLPGTYFSKREEGDEWLDWADSSRNLYNKIRAITRPGPGARTVLEGKLLTIWRAYYDPTWPSYIATPGQVVGSSAEGVVVKAGDSTLWVQEVQFEGDVPHIPQWRIGTRLGINWMAYLHSLEARLAILERGKQ